MHTDDFSYSSDSIAFTQLVSTDILVPATLIVQTDHSLRKNVLTIAKFHTWLNHYFRGHIRHFLCP